MNKLKLVSLAMFAMMIFACEKSFAQTQDPKDQQTNQNTGTPNPDAAQAPATDPSSTDGTQPSTVTIDSTGTGTTPTPDASTSGTNSGVRESTTKIHIYSGKQDGNNVINPDPKN